MLRPCGASSCAGLLLLALVLALALPRPALAWGRTTQSQHSLPPVTPAGAYLCRIEGDCLPCPADELHTPVCKLFGNRRPLSCALRLDHHPSSSASTTARSDSSNSTSRGAALAASLPRVDPALSPAEQELRDAIDAERRRIRRSRSRSLDDDEDESSFRLLEPRDNAGGPTVIHTWEACPKVLRNEYHDYFEFIMCNLAFALVGCTLLAYRQRTLALRQFGRLAARIMQTEVL